MKKLMFAAAAIVAGVAVADVTSANVVGYMDTELRAGNLMISPVFSKISLDKQITIDDIQVKGYIPWQKGVKGSGTTKAVQIKVLDAAGANAKEESDPTKERVYYYYDDEDTAEGAGPGWYRTNSSAKNKVTGIKFSMGDGLWVQGKDGMSLQIAGEVNVAELTIPLRAGNTPCGNPYAAEISLADISVTGYIPWQKGVKGSGTTKAVQIKVLDAAGANAKEAADPTKERVYYYYDDEDTAEGAGPGWYRTNSSAKNKLGAETKFKAGEGLWVQGKDGMSLEIKSPINLGAE